jgi:hypothetical protein
MAIPQIAKDSIKQMVRQEMSGKTTELDWYIRSMINCWDMDNFESKQKASYAYQHYRISCEIRTWHRRNRHTTRKGSYHGYDCRIEAYGLWNIVTKGDIDGKAGGVSWQYRTVDGLKNVRVWFK